MTLRDRSMLPLVLTTVLLVGACGPNIESNTVIDAPPVEADREVRFHEEEPACELERLGNLRVEASDWPAARPDVEQTVREMGGEGVVGWEAREVVVDPGDGGGSGVPGASSSRAHRDEFYFGVVVRFPERCPEA